MSNISRVFVGTLNRDTYYFKQAHGEGICILDLDEETGTLVRRGVTVGIENPSFLTFDRDRRHVYATSEVFGWNEGTMTAYEITKDGSLRYINKQVVQGSITTHCSLDRTEQFLFAVNYAHEDWPGYGPDIPGRAVVVLPVMPDGGLGPVISAVSHTGRGPVPGRQTCPHPHCAVASPDNRFVIVTDLGTDLLHSYRFSNGQLTCEGASTPLKLPPGSGPRHFIFARGGERAYVINELGGSVAYLGYDAPSGAFEIRQIISTLPPSYTALNNCADLHLSPDGRFLYGSNRGHDSIVIFSVDEHSGNLSLIGQTPTGGEWPRGCALSRTGKFLLVANQNSDSIIIFRRNERTGELAPTGSFALGTSLAVTVHPL
jgi:6-phosphogluconolactonase